MGVPKISYRLVKRVCDLFVSFFLLFILFPIFLLIVLAIKLDSPGPVLFCQRRVGSKKKHFHILKFRTMRVNTPRDRPTHLLENPDKWVTRMGKFLRKTSLDEIPQLLNILKGEMSFIGPRPALWNQYDLIEERDRYQANDVPVGLSGWAQINGRDELLIPDKAKLDGEYVKNFGCWMDLRCLWGTFFSVIFGRGVVDGGAGSKKKQ